MRKIICLCLIAALLWAAWGQGVCRASSAITYGSKNDDIVQMQKRLKELGYFSGECTGYYGDETQTAVSNFQKANGLSATGTADPATVSVMRAESAVTKQQYIESSKGSAINMTLSPGDSGKWVRKLQELLSSLGYFSEPVTGNYGSVTEYAVSFFQLVNGITVTGIADSDTLTQLTAPSAIPVGVYKESLVLEYGDSGSDVKTLQLYLQKLGYFSGDCSAKFGKNTQEAVACFQRCNGLTESGKCDVAMRLLLLSGKSVCRADAEAAEAVRALKLGDTCDSVKALKNQLKSLGYYTGDIDTQYTAALAEAVSTFQAANSLPATGNADAATRARINRGDCVSMAAYTANMSACEVRMGDSGFSVMLLQTRLKELGYYSGETNGVFDKTTKNAVVFFQRGHTLEETGVADAETRKCMNAKDALTYAQAEAQYYQRKLQKENETKLKTLCDTALSCVSKAYGNGKAGANAFDNAGLVAYCFSKINVALENTVAAQLEKAKKKDTWSGDIHAVGVGRQVFLSSEGQVITGVYIGEDIFVYASSQHGMVIAVEKIMATGKFEFIGSVSHF